MEEIVYNDLTPEEYIQKAIHADTNVLQKMLQQLEEKVIPQHENVAISSFLKHQFELFEQNEEFTSTNTASNEDHILNSIDRPLNKLLLQINILHHRFHLAGLIQPKASSNDKEKVKENNDQYLLRFNRLFEILHYSISCIRNLYHLKKATKYDPTQNTDVGLYRFNKIDYAGLEPHQELILYLNNKLLEYNLRRQGEYCMERINTPDNFDTHAWKPVKKIEKFVAEETRQSNNFLQWMNCTQKSNTLSFVIQYLKKSQDIFFIDVEKDFRFFSYYDGIYCTIEEYTDEVDGKTKYTDRFYHHKRERSTNKETLSYELDSRITACNYVEQYVRWTDTVGDSPLEEWYTKISTPNFQKILEFQDLPDEAIQFVYILIGRLLHKYNKYDNWQVVPYIKGVAGTGKSTILLDVCRKFFQEVDVGIISNNIEKKFGLSALLDKRIFIAPEYGKMGVTQTDFQQMVSGEELTIPKKFESAETTEWDKPGIIAGNMLPGYNDNQGSLARRILLIIFGNVIPEEQRDPSLNKKLQKELPLILIKCNRAYIHTINHHAHQDIWSFVPSYFKETQQEMCEDINSLVSFLNQCSKLKFAKNKNERLYCALSDFVELYNEYVKNNNLPKGKWNKDFYDQPLRKKGCKVTKAEPRYNPNLDEPHTRKVVKWIDGVAIIDEYCGEEDFSGDNFLDDVNEEDDDQVKKTAGSKKNNKGNLNKFKHQHTNASSK